MARNIDTALLRAFVTVAETGGMTRAGQLLNLTQAAVSQQVKRLEDQFQTQLFDRDKKRVSLTPDGERLLPMAQQMLDMNDRVWGMMTTADFEGQVRVGVPHDIVKAFMPPVLKSFDRAWPRVSVTLVPGPSMTLLEDMQRGDIDLTLTTEEGVQPGGEVLLRDELVWVGGRGGKAHLNDPLPLTLGYPNCVFRASCTAALASVDRSWRAVVDNGNMLSIYAALEADLAVSALLASTIPEGLVVLAPESRLPPLPPFSINLYLPKGAGEIAQEFAQHVRDQFRTRYRRAA